MELREKFAGRWDKAEIKAFCEEMREDSCRQQRVFALTADADRRVVYNAYWVLSHFVVMDRSWLATKREILIDRVLAEPNDGVCRLLLTVLLHLPFGKEQLRQDFLDFCMQTVALSRKPCAVRVLCLKLAYEQCKFYPELLQELQSVLAVTNDEPLPAGLRVACKNIGKKR